MQSLKSQLLKIMNQKTQDKKYDDCEEKVSDGDLYFSDKLVFGRRNWNKVGKKVDSLHILSHEFGDNCYVQSGSQKCFVVSLDYVLDLKHMIYCLDFLT